MFVQRGEFLMRWERTPPSLSLSCGALADSNRTPFGHLWTLGWFGHLSIVQSWVSFCLWSRSTRVVCFLCGLLTGYRRQTTWNIAKNFQFFFANVKKWLIVFLFSSDFIEEVLPFLDLLMQNLNLFLPLEIGVWFCPIVLILAEF
jgi:hypothetical protein